MITRIKCLVNALNFQPAWLIFMIDGFFSMASATIVYLLLMQSSNQYGHFPLGLAMFKFLFCGIISTSLTKSYRGVIRHTSFEDILVLLNTLSLQLVLVLIFELISWAISGIEPLNAVAYHGLSSLLCLFFFFNYRMGVRYLFHFSKSSEAGSIRTGIFGAGESGILLLNYLKNDKKSKASILMFFDDEISKCGKIIKGVPVFEGEMVDYFAKKYALDQIIVSPRIISNERKEELFVISKKLGISLKIISNDDLWFTGRKAPENLHDMDIQDLLGREQISTDNSEIREMISGEIILVTGAAGSIGSELCRQIIRQNPKELLILDQAESPLYEIAIELRNINPDTKLTSFLCDVGNEKRLEQVFLNSKIKTVFHAAAYKHVPMQEQHPYEAVYCNIKGTFNLANLSIKYSVDKFIMVSTDKAVNPTNIMGATKRAAEIYIQSLDFGIKANNTQFITTRFGNVLGSNGSVVPLFKKQIAAGGPVTLTHPEITRYFMTISEASNLVLEAAAMGEGGEIFVFDMGKPIKIKDLAEKMIQLSGKYVPIKYTGLREGEKLHEELLADGENTRPTYNKKIMIARVRTYEYAEVLNIFTELFAYMERIEERNMIIALKLLVPEFISNQSRFCELDKSIESGEHLVKTDEELQISA